MKGIHVYGDSFTSRDWAGIDSWPDIMAKKINAVVNTNAKAGSSTEYSMLKFAKDVHANTIRDGDIVIFVLSTPGRIPLKFINEHYPEGGVLFIREPHKASTTREAECHKWYWDNKEHIDWFLVNFDRELHILNHECYFNTVLNFARSRPNVTVVMFDSIEINYRMLRGDFPKNFLYPSRFYLFEIACREFVFYDKKRNERADAYRLWTKYLNYVDPRINHLSIPNINILVDQILYSMENSTVENFTLDKFVTDLFEYPVDEKRYEEYINKGYLLYNVGIAERFKQASK